MYVKLQMELKTENKDVIPFQKANILQSVLMDRIDSEYAENLHISGLHPYSQSVVNENGINIWTVCTTNEEAYHKIIEPLCEESFSDFEIRHNDWKVSIADKRLYKISRKQFMDKYYFEDSEKYIKVSFITPAAFKSQGQYVFYPDLQLLYQSLINKYDEASVDESLKSDELTAQLVEYSTVTGYNLRSIFYNIGQNRIPAFMGNMTIRINGPQAMVNFVNMLFRFGEYSGIGIKTAIGMGSIKIIERVRV